MAEEGSEGRGSAPSTPDPDDFDAKPRLGDLRYDGLRPIAGWQFLQPLADVRIYYDLNDSAERSGFHFYAVEYVGCYVDDVAPVGIDHPEARFECLLYGWAAFDGIRHLYVREGDDAGYLHYPHLDDLIVVLGALRSLELKHCWDARQSGPDRPEVPRK